MAQPPFPAPDRIQILGVLPGEFSSADGGWLSRDSGDVTVRIDGDTGGVFSVVGLEIFALRVSHDPDLPPGPHPRSWESVTAVDGPGPVRATVGEALVVTIGFACPAGSTQAAFDALAVIVGADGSLGSLPIEAQVASIRSIEVSPSSARITFPRSLSAGSGESTTQQFLVVAGVSDGSTRQVDPALVSWTSSATNTADVDDEGMATGLEQGISFITAIYHPTASPGSFESQAQLNVEG
jgi:hypothetical protein